jgi:hypothetical protein
MIPFGLECDIYAATKLKPLLTNWDPAFAWNLRRFGWMKLMRLRDQC